MKIIEEMINELPKMDNLDRLKAICNKMKSENNHVVDYFETSEILYYHKYDDTEYFENYLILSFDMLDSDTFFIEKWQVKKINESENDYKKIKSYKIASSNINNVLVKYATILKRAINNEI